MLAKTQPSGAMKPIKTKAQIRAEIDHQVDDFLAKGGAVSQFRQGESGRENNSQLAKPPHLERNEQTRTPVMSEIKAIEARRQKPKTTTVKKTRRRNGEEKKALLVDDFGEPLRWVPKS